MKHFSLKEVLRSTIWGAVLLFFLFGCASLGTYNPATGRREFILIPTDQEVSMGNDIHRQLLTQYKLCINPGEVDRVRRIGARLAQVSDRQDFEYQFFVIEKDELNAFTVPGGRIYFFTGLLRKSPDDDAVAGVLAHEIGHCSARHTVKKFQAAVGYQLIGDIVLSQMSPGEQAQRIASLSSGTIMNLIFSAYGRRDEYEADRLGIKYLNLAGYHLDGMIETLELLQKEIKGDNIPLILRTHPYAADRVVAAKKEIERIKHEEGGS